MAKAKRRVPVKPAFPTQVGQVMQAMARAIVANKVLKQRFLCAATLDIKVSGTQLSVKVPVLRKRLGTFGMGRNAVSQEASRQADEAVIVIEITDVPAPVQPPVQPGITKEQRIDASIKERADHWMLKHSATLSKLKEQMPRERIALFRWTDPVKETLPKIDGDEIAGLLGARRI